MRQALELALEALEYHTAQTRPIHQTNETITAIKEALAQPEQEPMAWMNDSTPSGIFARHMEGAKNFGCTIPLYTTPPQRTWVGLTEQEHTDIAVECGCMSADWVFYGAAVERKVKERNT